MKVLTVDSPPLNNSLKKQLKTLEDKNFSLVKYCLDNRNDENIAFVTKGLNCKGKLIKYTYKQLKEHAKFVANFFISNGVKKGDKILLLQNNSLYMAVCYWATHYIGAVAVCAVPSHPNRAFFLRYTNCKIVVAPKYILSELQKEITSYTNIRLVYITESDNEIDRELKVNSKHSENEYFENNKNKNYKIKTFHKNYKYDKLIYNKIQKYMENITSTDECCWYFTSGTTGKPKGCIHKQIDLAFAGLTYGKHVMVCRKQTVTATDTLMAGPYAMGSNMVFPFIFGGTVVLDHIIDCNINKPKCIFENFENINTYISVPDNISKIVTLLDNSKFVMGFKDVCVVTSAGAMLPASTFLNFNFKIKEKKLKAQVLDGIGTSEMQHIFISNYINDQQSHKNSIGKLVPGYEAILIDIKKNGDNISGELGIRTINDNIMVDYSCENSPKNINIKSKVKEVIFNYKNKKYYITGDVAMIKKQEPYFYLLGRKRDLGNQFSNDNRNNISSIMNKNTIMLKGGLLENNHKVNKKIYKSIKLNKLPNIPLIKDIHSIVTGNMEVYVIVVNEEHWKIYKNCNKIIEQWKKIIAPKFNVVFQPSNYIPTTCPPLCKPIKHCMQKNIDFFKDTCNPNKSKKWLRLSKYKMKSKKLSKTICKKNIKPCIYD